jgi:hypothetical protein
MIIPDWVPEPFSNLQTAELSLQEELIELSTNKELKLKLKNGYQEFWLQRQIPVIYPALWVASQEFFIAFLFRFKIADDKYGTKYRKISVITPSLALSLIILY